MTDAERLERLEALVEQLQQRIETLEADQEATDFSVLQRLQQRRGDQFEHAGLRGSVLYAGAVSGENKRLIWQAERGFPRLVNIENPAAVRILAALGHPIRLEIVQMLLEASATSQDFQARLDSSSTGQLYHHLKELRAAGIVAQASRGEYHLVPQTIIPVLAILAATLDIITEAPE